MANLVTTIDTLRTDLERVLELAGGTTKEQHAFNLFVDEKELRQFAKSVEFLVNDIEAEVAES